MPAMLAAAMLAAAGGGWQQDDGSDTSQPSAQSSASRVMCQAKGSCVGVSQSCARPREAVIKELTTAGGKTGHARQPCHRNTREAGRVDRVVRQ